MLLPAALLADVGGTTSQPGFRPGAEVERDRKFVEALAKGSVAIIPAIVRTVDGRTHDTAIAAAVAEFARVGGIATRVSVGHAELSLPDIPGGVPQFDAFKRELAALESAVGELGPDEDFVLVLEFLVTPRRRGGEAVGGIHCFILTRDGRNAFSFLLNTHHEIFVKADLRTREAGSEARAEMLGRAAQVAIEALEEQIAGAER